MHKLSSIKFSDGEFSDKENKEEIDEMISVLDVVIEASRENTDLETLDFQSQSLVDDKTPKRSNDINPHEKRVTFCESIPEVLENTYQTSEIFSLDTDNRTKNASSTPFNFTIFTPQESQNKTPNHGEKLNFRTPNSSSYKSSSISQSFSASSEDSVDLKRKYDQLNLTEIKNLKRRKLSSNTN